MSRFLAGLLILAASGCATMQSQQQEPPVIPVYEYAEGVPCRFQEMQGLHHRMTVVVQSGDEFNAIRNRELAKLGAAIGADAVIVAQPPEHRPLTINIETPMTAIFDGTAIRYLENPCGPPSKRGGGGGGGG